MTGIFPNVGGVLVRDPDTHLPTNPPNVDGVLVPPVPFNMDCDMTALPNDCSVVVENRQVNAIVSELVNLAATMDPDGLWECTEYNNLATAFLAWVAAFAGSQTGELLCISPEGPGTETGAALIYCDGATIKKLLVDGEAGLFQLIQAYLCDSEIGDPNLNDDYMLYCRNGVFRKVQAVTFQLYTGEWVQARSYVTVNLVRKNKKLYSPNATIPSGTAFVIGTAGQTWYEVSATDFSEYDPSESYLKDAVIQYQGKVYAANADIPAGTAFTIGTTGQTWRLVDTTQSTFLDHSTTKSYVQYSAVTVNGLIYRTNVPVAPGAFVPAPTGPWYLIGGERNKFVGDWSIGNNLPLGPGITQRQYLEGQLVVKDDLIYRANADIPLATAFTIGTTGATWKEISASATPPYTPDVAYSQDAVIQYTDGKYYAANADIPAGTAFVIGTTGQTWRLISLGGTTNLIRNHDATKTYAGFEVAAYDSGDTVSGTLGIWRAKAAGVPAPGAFNPNLWDLIGDRSKYRGRWQPQAFLNDDLVYWTINISGVNVYELFRAEAAIVAGATDPFQNANWAPMSKMRGEWFQARRYVIGDIVTRNGRRYVANANIAYNTAFALGFTGATWRLDEKVELLDINNVGAFNNSLIWWDKYVQLSGATAKTVTIQPNSALPFPIGTVFTGVSVGGQTTFVAGAGVTIRTPATLALKNVSYAAFALTKVNTDEWHLTGYLA